MDERGFICGTRSISKRVFRKRQWDRKRLATTKKETPKNRKDAIQLCD